MPASNYLYTLRETNPALDTTTVRIGPTITGSFGVTSSAPNERSLYPILDLQAVSLNTKNDTCYLVSVFSSTIPRRFTLEVSFTGYEKMGFNGGNFFWGIGTESSASADICLLGFGFENPLIVTVTTGVFSSSNNGFTSDFIADKRLMYTSKEFELQKSTPTQQSDISFRCRDYTANTQQNGTVQFHMIYDSDGLSWPNAWIGKTFNKLYLGYCTTDGVFSERMLIDSIRVKKHFMDWE